MAAPFTLLSGCGQFHSFTFKNVREPKESKNQNPDKFRMMQVHVGVYVFSAGVAIRMSFVLIANGKKNTWIWAIVSLNKIA